MGDPGDFQTVLDRIKVRKGRIKIRKKHSRKNEVLEIGRRICPHYLLESGFRPGQY